MNLCEAATEMVNGITWLISYCKKRSLGSVKWTGLTRFTGFERPEHENDKKTDSDVDGCQH